MKLMTPAIASEPYTAEAPSFSISTRSMAANGMTPRFTPPTPWISPAKPFTRLPLMRTSVCAPCRPRSEAVCAEKVLAPMTLVIVELPRLLFDETRFSSSIALVAPLLSISSRVMTVTGSALSPSTLLMLEPVTSMRSLAAGCCAQAGAAAARPSAPITAMANPSSLRFMFSPGVFVAFETLKSAHGERQRNSSPARTARCWRATARFPNSYFHPSLLKSA